MTKYAVMNGDSVVNIIITEDKEQAEKDLNVILIESTEDNKAKINDRYINGKFYSEEELAKLAEENTDAGV